MKDANFGNPEAMLGVVPGVASAAKDQHPCVSPAGKVMKKGRLLNFYDNNLKPFPCIFQRKNVTHKARKMLSFDQKGAVRQNVSLVNNTLYQAFSDLPN